MALTKIKTSNLETSIDLTGINDTATSQILTVSDTGIDVTGTVTADGLTVENNTTDVKGTVKNTLTSGVRTATLDILPQNDGDYGVSIQASGGDGTGTFQFNNKNIMKFDFSNDISFYEATGTTAKFFWDASAERLGIGGIPENELDVRGTVEIGNGSTNRMYLGYSGSDFRLYDRAATTERMRIDSSGNVGIGTSSPDKPLHINTSNSGAAQDYIKTGGTSRYGNGLNKLISFHHGYWGGSQEVASVGVETTSSAGGAGHGYGNLVFYTGESGNGDSGSTSTERMRINSGGNCSIGETSNPGYRLSLKHTGTVQLNNRDGSDGANILFQRSGTNVGSITVTSSSTTYATSSDYRLKENVVPMTGSIDRLKALNPSRFNFIADPDTTVDGFLAHEAQEVVPEAITGTKDAMRTEEYEVTPAVEATYDDDDNELTPAVEAVMGEREVPDMQGIDQAKLVPLLVGALQEQQTLIESLTTRLEALEGV